MYRDTSSVDCLQTQLRGVKIVFIIRVSIMGQIPTCSGGTVL